MNAAGPGSGDSIRFTQTGCLIKTGHNKICSVVPGDFQSAGHNTVKHDGHKCTIYIYNKVVAATQFLYQIFQSTLDHYDCLI
jgi:hypothetical protein